jgi:hypothetical protein
MRGGRLQVIDEDHHLLMEMASPIGSGVRE